MKCSFNFKETLKHSTAEIEITTDKGETFHMFGGTMKTKSEIIDKAFTIFRQEQLIPNN